MNGPDGGLEKKIKLMKYLKTGQLILLQNAILRLKNFSKINQATPKRRVFIVVC